MDSGTRKQGADSFQKLWQEDCYYFCLEDRWPQKGCLPSLISPFPVIPILNCVGWTHRKYSYIGVATAQKHPVHIARKKCSLTSFVSGFDWRSFLECIAAVDQAQVLQDRGLKALDGRPFGQHPKLSSPWHLPALQFNVFGCRAMSQVWYGLQLFFTL